MVHSHGGHGHGHSHGAGHSHGVGHSHHDLRNESKKGMLTVLALTGTYMVIECVTGYFTGSLAMFADAGHMLSDVAALVLSLLAVWFASKPATPGKTYGYYRSEILAGFFNALALVVLSLVVLYEAYRRLSSPPEVHGIPVLVVAAIGLIMQLVSLKMLKKSADASINTRAAYLEILGDSLASVGVIISSLIIIFTRWYLADPIISGIIGLAILPRTWLLLSECINILMEGTPGHIDLSSLREAITAVPGVQGIHDMHVWTITSGLDAMSGHIIIDSTAPAEEVLTNVTKILNEDFDLHHTTIQVEQLACKGTGESCSA
ncbi:MAG: cation transporter [Candidatus Melainabacteria bacterium]|nr:MAG: cation transporter [Candidatus Melainabacteria bacterium]